MATSVGTIKWTLGSVWDLHQLLDGYCLANASEGFCWVCDGKLDVEGWTGPDSDPTAILICPCCLVRYQRLDDGTVLCDRMTREPACKHWLAVIGGHERLTHHKDANNG